MRPPPRLHPNPDSCHPESSSSRHGRKRRRVTVEDNAGGDDSSNAVDDGTRVKSPVIRKKLQKKKNLQKENLKGKTILEEMTPVQSPVIQKNPQKKNLKGKENLKGKGKSEETTPVQSPVIQKNPQKKDLKGKGKSEETTPAQSPVIQKNPQKKNLEEKGNPEETTPVRSPVVAVTSQAMDSIPAAAVDDPLPQDHGNPTVEMDCKTAKKSHKRKKVVLTDEEVSDEEEKSENKKSQNLDVKSEKENRKKKKKKEKNLKEVKEEETLEENAQNVSTKKNLSKKIVKEKTKLKEKTNLKGKANLEKISNHSPNLMTCPVSVPLTSSTLPGILPNLPGKLLPTLPGIFPALPDDVAINCFSRLKLKQRQVSRSVNQEWNNFLSSPKIYKERASNGLLEDHLCICQVDSSTFDKTLHLFVHLFNYKTRFWLTLPPLKNLGSGGLFDDYVCITHGPKLFIIGGKLSNSPEKTSSRECDQMWIFDSLKGKWEEGPRMVSTRSQFFAGIINDCLYVVDGAEDGPSSSSMDVLSLDQNFNCGEWFTLPIVYQNSSLSSQGSFVKDGKLYVVKTSPQDQEFFDVYDPVSSKWSATCSFELEEKSYVSCGATFAVVNGRIFGIFSNILGTDIDLIHSIKCFDESRKTWETVACYDHFMWSEFKQVEYLHLLAVGTKLFVVASGVLENEESRTSFSVLGFQNGLTNAEWELTNFRVQRPMGNEHFLTFAVTSFSI